MFERDAKQHTELIALLTGRERHQERLAAISPPHQLHENHPEVGTMYFPESSWETTDCQYISGVTDGARRLLRMLPDSARVKPNTGETP